MSVRTTRSRLTAVWPDPGGVQEALQAVVRHVQPVRRRWVVRLVRGALDLVVSWSGCCFFGGSFGGLITTSVLCPQPLPLSSPVARTEAHDGRM